MSYSHFGEIGDVWKHLPLGEILKIEKPQRYLETNSAYPKYTVKQNWKTDYGIKWFLRNCNKLSETEYAKIESKALISDEYLGSPAIAFNILGNSCQEYHLCDIEQEALKKNISFARELSINNIYTHLGDSRTTSLKILSKFNNNDFIHIDPYTIFDSNSENHSYSKLFELSLKNNVKSLLWYGYDSNKSKKEIRQWIKTVVNSNLDNSIKQYEIEVVNFSPSLNPGIKGCGILIANISQQSFDVVEEQFNFLLNIYSSVKIKDGLNLEIKGYKL